MSTQKASPISAVRTFETTAEAYRAAAEAKRQATVSVCIPCRNEAATIGPIVALIVRALMGVGGIVDELLVFDDDSTDTTASVATAAGARVIRVADVLPDLEQMSGKGNVLWKSVAASYGDIIVWCDGDLLSFTPDYVRDLVVPLLLDSSIAMVKGFYERLPDEAGEGGGRNTELVARPLLALLFPELVAIRQPLGGEYSARRSVLEQVSFATGYGVEVGLLIDIAARVGVGAIAQVDLGIRRHRHRPLRELSAQSAEILHAILTRSDLPIGRLSELTQFPPTGSADSAAMRAIPVRTAERPPLATVATYQRPA